MLPPLHLRCRCTLEEMDAIEAGNATNNRVDGADYWLKHYGHLPSYYISSVQLEALGWRYGDRPSKFAPGRMLGGDIYDNEIENCRIESAGYGMNPISTIRRADAIGIEFFGQTTD